MASVEFTAEERIRQLSSINAEVAEMIKHAGQAINALTNRPLSESEDEDGDEDMADHQQSFSADDRREAFKRHTTAFYVGVQSITAQLRRNVYGLEEAAIITSEASTAQSTEQPVRPGAGLQAGRTPKEEAPRITNGGMGNLDVGWLNSKGNKVGAEKENELMKEAKDLLESELKGGEET